MNLRCIIVDDEAPARDELSFIVSEIGGVDIVDTASSASSAVTAVKKHRPDLIFLDIQMPGSSGFDVVKSIAELPVPPLVIFATAFDRYAVRAFEENAIDYILKPFSEERVRMSIERANDFISSKSSSSARVELDRIIDALTVSVPDFSRIAVEKNGRILLLNPEEVICIKSENRIVTAVTKDGRFTCHGSQTLDRLEEKLKRRHFFRTHRAFLANLAHVREVTPWFNGKYLLVMDDAEKTEVTVSRTRVGSLKKIMGF